MSMSSTSRLVHPLLALPEEERRLGPFRLIRQLGRGGFAPVWLAEEAYDGKKLRDVAIKLFFLPEGLSPATPEAARWREEILDEARALCRVEHPNVVRFYTIQQDDTLGVVGLAMEYAPGRSLDVLVREAGRLEERTAIDIGIDVAWALAAVHNAGLVHRDIKPANIIQGASGGYKLIDFGIVAADPGVHAMSPPSIRVPQQAADEGMHDAVTLGREPKASIEASTLGLAPTAVISAASMASSALSTRSAGNAGPRAPVAPPPPERGTAPPLVGTLGYMAPECFEENGHATPASDLYALGVTLFTLMTGSLPVAVGAGDVLPADWYIARGPAPRFESTVTVRTAMTSGFSDLTALLLEPNPDVRPRYADWVARELELLRGRLGMTEGGAPSRRSYSSPPPVKSSRPRQTGLFLLLSHEDRSPEPLLPLFAEVERTCVGDDPAEAGRALGELGLAILRYTFALGLSLLASSPEESASGVASAPRRLGAMLEQLRSAARPTHSSWCYLVRSLYETIAVVYPDVGPRFAFAAERPISERLGALLRGVSTSAAVEQGILWITALLNDSAPLLSLPVRISRYSPSQPTVDFRSRARSPAPAFLSATFDGIGSPVAPLDDEATGAPHVLLDRRWIQLSPWLPYRDGRHLLPEAPSAPGKPWRSTDPETGERRDDPELDQAVHRLAGEDPDVPREICQTPPLVGRDEVLAVLARLTAEARSGGVRVVVLTGPLGIGRTRLLDAAIDHAGYGPERVLRAGCSPERQSPLRPLQRALEALPRGEEQKLGPLEDAMRRALSPTEIQRANQVTEGLEGVEDALVLASAEAPLLLAIDDIQWADAHTLELLKLLVERADVGGSGHLLVVTTSRNEPNPGAPLRALLSKVRAKVRPAVRHVALGPLTASETAILAQAVSPIAPELERAVARGSGGVPFFLVHALLVWREKGAIAWRQGAWHAVDERVLSEDVPGVADLIEARIASYLDPGSGPGRAALRALAGVALYGGGLGIDTILRIAGDEINTETALEALVDGGILTVSGERQEYGFAQEMVRQSVLNLVRQRPWFHRLHRGLLDVVAEGPSPDAAFLAIGYDKLGAAEQARTWLARAIEGRIAAGLFGEAAEFGDRLAALTADPEARAAVELGVVRALIDGRKFEEAKRRLLRAGAGGPRRDRTPSDLRRRIYRLEIARGLYEAGVEDPTLIADADALGELAFCCEARVALAGTATGRRALELASEAVALSERCGLAVEFAARVLRSELNYASDYDVEMALCDLHRALEIAKSTSSPWQRIHIESDLAVLEAELGRGGAAIDRLRRLAEEAEAMGMRGQLRLLSQNLSAFLLREGRHGEAAEAALRTADLATEAGDPVLRATALSLRADALRRSGELDAALKCATEAEQLQRERGDRMQALTLLRRAEILDALGRIEDALDASRHARRVAERFGERGIAVTAALWDALHLIRRGAATPEQLKRALSEATAPGVVQRAMTKSLVAQANEWLSAARQGG